MRSRSSTPTILDIMIVIATVAIGLGVGRSWVIGLVTEISGYARLPPQTHTRTILAARAMSLLIPTGIGVLTLRGLRPLPRTRLLACKPGTVACLSATVGVLVAAANLKMDLRTMGSFVTPLLLAAWYWPGTIGAAVLSGWGLLYLGRGWHPGDWVDGLGILVGLSWIGLLPILWVVEFL